MTTKDYAAIVSVEQLAKLAAQLLAEGKPIGFDLETGYRGDKTKKRSLDHYNANQFVVGFSLTNDPSWARYIPLAHDDGGNIDDPDGAWEAVRELLTKGHIVAHNAKFERAGVWKAAKISLAAEGILTDTMLDAFVSGIAWHPNYRTMVGLKDLVKELLGHQMMHIHELWPDLPSTQEPFIRFNTLPVSPEVTAYACEDAAWVLPLRDIVTPAAEEIAPFIRGLEHAVLPVVDEMERHGVAVDWDGIAEAYSQSESFVPAMEEHVKTVLGAFARRDLSDLNLRSAQQMKELLFKDMGLTTTRLTAKGSDESQDLEPWQRMSSDKKSLTALANENEGIQSLLGYREVQNLTKRISKWLKEYHDCYDGKVHANYNQVQVGSGRFSANEPAIQQLPKKWKWVISGEEENGVDHWKGNFRDFIIASPDHYLLTYDYSQIELRMLAGASQEPALLAAFAENADVHTRTAAMMLGKAPSEIDPETRQIGKTFNFALMYGMGPKSLAEQLGIEYDRAKELYSRYFETFSNITTWKNKTENLGLRRGYTETIFGRRIPVWELQSSAPAIRAKGSRVLINGAIQGSAADLMKIAMLRVHSTLKQRGWWGDAVTIIMNQHDALTFDVSNEIDPNELREILQPRVVFDETVTSVLTGFPKVRADWELGQRWGSSDKWSFEQGAAFEDGQWKVQPEKEFEYMKLTVAENPKPLAFATFCKDLKQTPGQTAIDFVCPQGVLSLPFKANVTPSVVERLKLSFEHAIIETK